MLSPLGTVEQILALNWKADVPSSLEVGPIIRCQPRVWEQVTAREAPLRRFPGPSTEEPPLPSWGRPLCCAGASSQVPKLSFSLACSLPHWAHPSAVFSTSSCHKLSGSGHLTFPCKFLCHSACSGWGSLVWRPDARDGKSGDWMEVWLCRFLAGRHWLHYLISRDLNFPTSVLKHPT